MWRSTRAKTTSSRAPEAVAASEEPPQPCGSWPSEQPRVRRGEDYQYTSGAVLETAVGTMRASYQMLSEDGTRFDAAIPEFTLSVPRTLH